MKVQLALQKLLSYFGRIPLILILLPCYVVCLVWAHFARGYPCASQKNVARLAGSFQTLEGTVDNFPSTKWDRTRFLLEGRSAQRPEFSGRILIQLRFSETTLVPGDRLRLCGWVRTLKTTQAADEFDEARYWAGLGVYAKLEVQTEEGILFHANSETLWGKLQQRMWEFRQRFIWFWYQRLTIPQAALLTGMTVGAREFLTTSFKNESIQAGIYHIIVVSGQNLGVLFLVLFPLRWVLGISKRWIALLIFPVIIVYAIMVGFDPPILRALGMSLFWLFLQFIRRDVPLTIIWALCAWGMLLVNPYFLFNASFQLSFASTGGLLIMMSREGPVQIHSLKLSHWFWETFRMSLGAQLAVIPILLYYFQSCSVAGFFASFVVLPLTMPVMILGLFGGSVGLATDSMILDRFLVPLLQLLICVFEKWILFMCSREWILIQITRHFST